ncbi:UNVERIFIED_CONTAM: hypothetical protein FKN15_007895 [Acipenser sinensis]
MALVSRDDYYQSSRDSIALAEHDGSRSARSPKEGRALVLQALIVNAGYYLVSGPGQTISWRGSLDPILRHSISLSAQCNLITPQERQLSPPCIVLSCHGNLKQGTRPFDKAGPASFCCCNQVNDEKLELAQVHSAELRQ